MSPQFILSGSRPLPRSPSLSILYFSCSGSTLVKRTQPRELTDCTFSRERYSFLRLNFDSHSCCRTLRVLKTTTNLKSEQVQSQFGRVPLAPTWVNSAHVGSILTPFCFPYNFLGASSQSSPRSHCSWGRAPGWKSLSHRKRGFTHKGSGLGFLGNASPPWER